MPYTSLEKAFLIIERLAQSEVSLGVRQLARELGLSVSSTHRYLSSLKDLGYVTQGPEDEQYRLSFKIAWLASLIMKRMKIRSIARPWMKKLSEISKETIHLATREEDEIVYLDKIDSTRAMKMQSSVGGRACLHSTAVGKVFLAYLPEELRTNLLCNHELKALTPNTITDPRVLEKELEQIRESGYAVDNEENESGIRCVGVPIYDHIGEVVYALSVSGWVKTLTKSQTNALLPQVLEASRSISRDLGHFDGKREAPLSVVASSDAPSEERYGMYETSHEDGD